MSKPIYVLNGPSLNLLGVREPHIYGTTTLDQVKAMCEARAATHGTTVVFRQSNHEGQLVDWIHEARADASVIVINPAAYGHTSIALLDALKATELPVIELHLSNPDSREPWRRSSVVAPVATGCISGLGGLGYRLAIDAVADLLGR